MDDRTAAATLSEALRHGSGPVVGRAATMAMERGLPALTNDLASAIDRLLRTQQRPAELVGCGEAITALYQLGWRDPAIAVAGLACAPDARAHYVVSQIRLAGALAAANLGHPSGMPVLGELLGDPDSSIRIATARILGSLASENADALLRLKVLCGDREIQVTYECLAALVRASGPAAREFFERLTTGRDPRTAEQAALALGETRATWGVQVLRTAWSGTRDGDLRATFLLSVAMIRSQDGIEFLLRLVGDGLGRDARDAVEALGVLCDDPGVCARVVQAARERGDVAVGEAVRKVFGAADSTGG
jgi:HEAT repeat protein